MNSNGKLLIYAAKEKNNWNIYKLNLQNKKKEKLFNSNDDSWDPAFHPSSNLVVFASVKSDGPKILVFV